MIRRAALAGATLAAVLMAACSIQPQPSPSGMPAAGGLRLFVSNEESGTVSVIDVASRRVVHTIPVGKRPRGIRASHDGATVYVALSGSPVGGPNVDESTLPPPDRRYDGIGVIVTATGTLKTVLKSGTDPEQFALSADGRRLFIANEDAGPASVLDLTSDHGLGVRDGIRNKLVAASSVAALPDRTVRGDAVRLKWRPARCALRRQGAPTRRNDRCATG